MTTYVLLQGPDNGYYTVQIATSNKHFFLVDKQGYTEIDSGSWDEMHDKKHDLLDVENDKDIIRLYCEKRFTEIHTTEEMLHRSIELEPNFLDDKVFL